jgi:hypothetical protein
MDRFKEDLTRIKEMEDSINNNLKERAKAVKAGQPTTKVGRLFSLVIEDFRIIFLYKHLMTNL